MGTTTHIDSEVTVALQGTLDTFALADVLRLLASTKKTGCLRLSASRGPGQIWIDNGGVAGIQATASSAGTSPVEALFELLRSTEGSFTFDADVRTEAPTDPMDVEVLLADADLLLAEWRDIEAVVPSLDAVVRLRRAIDAKAVTIPKAQWPALVAVGGGATVAHIGSQLGLTEIPVSRVVRDLIVLGVAEIAPDEVELVDVAPEVHATPDPETAEEAPNEPEPVADLSVDTPAAALTPSPVIDLGAAAPRLPELHLGSEPAAEEAPSEASWADAPAWTLDEDASSDADDAAGLPTARPLRGRRAKAAPASTGPSEPERFVPLDLPGHAPSPATFSAIREGEGEDEGSAVDDLAAAFPGLANRATASTEEDEELARQLATLSPRAAEAVRAAAAAETAEERDAALDAAEAGDEHINRGMLLKFLSSVKS